MLCLYIPCTKNTLMSLILENVAPWHFFQYVMYKHTDWSALYHVVTVATEKPVTMSTAHVLEGVMRESKGRNVRHVSYLLFMCISMCFTPPPPHHFRCMYTFELKYRLHELKYHPILMAVVMFVGWGVRFVTGSLWVRDKSYLGRFKHTLHGILSAFPLYRKNIKRLVFKKKYIFI